MAFGAERPSNPVDIEANSYVLQRDWDGLRAFIAQRASEHPELPAYRDPTASNDSSNGQADQETITTEQLGHAILRGYLANSFQREPIPGGIRFIYSTGKPEAVGVFTKLMGMLGLVQRFPSQVRVDVDEAQLTFLNESMEKNRATFAARFLGHWNAKGVPLAMQFVPNGETARNLVDGLRLYYPESRFAKVANDRGRHSVVINRDLAAETFRQTKSLGDLPYLDILLQVPPPSRR